jgi:hypothetical protein
MDEILRLIESRVSRKAHYADRLGFDCTIPWGEKWVQSDFQRSAPFELGDPPAGVSPMTEDQIAKEMDSFIRNSPRSWKELLQHFKGQNYRDVYRAFGRLRSKLGRVVQPPFFPYAFSDTGDFIGDAPTAPPKRTQGGCCWDSRF